MLTDSSDTSFLKIFCELLLFFPSSLYQSHSDCRISQVPQHQKTEVLETPSIRHSCCWQLSHVLSLLTPSQLLGSEGWGGGMHPGEIFLSQFSSWDPGKERGKQQSPKMGKKLLKIQTLSPTHMAQELQVISSARLAQQLSTQGRGRLPSCSQFWSFSLISLKKTQCSYLNNPCLVIYSVPCCCTLPSHALQEYIISCWCLLTSHCTQPSTPGKARQSPAAPSPEVWRKPVSADDTIQYQARK